MKIDYRITDAALGGLTFNFFPRMHAFAGQDEYDRHALDVFSVREEAFSFIEGMVARVVSDWRNYRHWGVTWLPKETWLEILSLFPELRCDVRGNVCFKVLIEKYYFAPGLLPRKHKLHRKALLRFLDQFEHRVRTILDRYPYLVIWGI